VAGSTGDGVVQTQVNVVKQDPAQCGPGVGHLVDAGGIVVLQDVFVVMDGVVGIGVVVQVLEVYIEVLADDFIGGQRGQVVDDYFVVLALAKKD
jgi:hypothetical protein